MQRCKKLIIENNHNFDVIIIMESDISMLKEAVLLMHSELRVLQNETKSLKEQLNEAYIEIDSLNEKLTTNQSVIDGKIEYICGLIDNVNIRCDNIESR